MSSSEVHLISIGKCTRIPFGSAASPASQVCISLRHAGACSAGMAHSVVYWANCQSKQRSTPVNFCEKQKRTGTESRETHQAVKVKDLVAVIRVGPSLAVKVVPYKPADGRREGRDVARDEQQELDEVEADADVPEVIAPSWRSVRCLERSCGHRIKGQSLRMKNILL